MKRKVLLVLFQTFSEFEITVVTSLLKRKYLIETVSLVEEKIIGESGLIFEPHLRINEVSVKDYEAIIIPGGDMFHLKDADKLFLQVKEFYEARKLVAAICSGPFVLSKSGILDNHPFTVTFNKEQRDCLQFPVNNFIYTDLIHDENVITAQGHAFVKFGLEIARFLNCLNEEFDEDFYLGKGNKYMEEKV